MFDARLWCNAYLALSIDHEMINKHATSRCSEGRCRNNVPTPSAWVSNVGDPLPTSESSIYYNLEIIQAFSQNDTATANMFLNRSIPRASNALTRVSGRPRVCFPKSLTTDSQQKKREFLCILPDNPNVLALRKKVKG